MAGEIQIQWTTTGDTLYAEVRRATDGKIWNGATFEAYATANLATYIITMTEQGVASAYYVGDMPAVPSGIYHVSIFVQAGGSPAEGDVVAGYGDLSWDAVGSSGSPTYSGSIDEMLLGDINAVISRSGQPQAKSVLNALRKLLNHVDTNSVPGKMVTTREDDTTSAYQQDVTTDATAEPIVSVG